MHRLDCTKKTVSSSLYLMLPKPSDHRFLSKRHHKGLSHCKTPEISDHPFTSPPSPKEKKKGGPILFCPRTSILLLGVWVQLHGLSVWWDEYVCQGNNIQQDCAQGPGGDLKFSVTGLDDLWESVTCERYGSLQVHQRHWAFAWKGRCMEIRCPHGCRAWIYCKQMILAPRSASLDWERTGRLNLANIVSSSQFYQAALHSCAFGGV